MLMFPSALRCSEQLCHGVAVRQHSRALLRGRLLSLFVRRGHAHHADVELDEVHADELFQLLDHSTLP